MRRPPRKSILLLLLAVWLFTSVAGTGMLPAQAALNRDDLAYRANEAQKLAQQKIDALRGIVDRLTTALAVPGAYDEAQRHIRYANDLLNEIGAMRNRARDIEAAALGDGFISPSDWARMETDIIGFQTSLERGGSEINKKIGVITSRANEFEERVAAGVQRENEISRAYNNAATVLDNLTNYLSTLNRRIQELTAKGPLSGAEQAALQELQNGYRDLQRLAGDSQAIAALKVQLDQAKTSGDRDQALSILTSLGQQINKTYVDKINRIDSAIDNLAIQIAARQGDEKKNEELRRQAETLINQAAALEARDPKAAAEMFKRAAKLLRDTGNADSIARAQRLEERAEALLTGTEPPPESGGGSGDKEKKEKARQEAAQLESQARELEKQGQFAEAARVFGQAAGKYKEAGDGAGATRAVKAQQQAEDQEKERLRVAGLLAEAQQLLVEAEKILQEAEKLLAQRNSAAAEGLLKRARTQLEQARQKIAQAGSSEAAEAISQKIARLDAQINEKLAIASQQAELARLEPLADQLIAEANELAKHILSEDDRRRAEAKYKEAAELLEKAARLADTLGYKSEAHDLRQKAEFFARDFKKLIETGGTFSSPVSRLIQVNPRGSSKIKAGDTVTYDVYLIAAGVTEATRDLIKTEDHAVKVVANNQLQIAARRIPARLDSTGKALFYEVAITVPSFMPGGSYPFVFEGYQNPDPKTNKTQTQPFLFYSVPVQIEVVSTPAPTSAQSHALLEQLGNQLLEARRRAEESIRDYEGDIDKLEALVSGAERYDASRGIRYTMTGTPWSTPLSKGGSILQPLASTAQYVFNAQESAAKRLMFGDGRPIAIVPGVTPGSGLQTSATEMARRWSSLAAAFSESGHAQLAGRVARLEQRAHELWVAFLQKTEQNISRLESAAQDLKAKAGFARRVLTLNGAAPVLTPEFGFAGAPGDLSAAISPYVGQAPAANHPIHRDINILQGAPAGPESGIDMSVVFPSTIAVQGEIFEKLDAWYDRLKRQMGEYEAYLLLRDSRSFNGKTLNEEANRLRTEAAALLNQIPHAFTTGSGQDIAQDALTIKNSIIGAGGTEKTTTDEYGTRSTFRSGEGLRYYYNYFDEVKNISPAGGPYESGRQTGFENSRLVPLVTIQDATGRTTGGALFVSQGGSVGTWNRGRFTGPAASGFLDTWANRLGAIPAQMPEVTVTQYYLGRAVDFYTALTNWSARKVLQAPAQAPPAFRPKAALSREQLLSEAKQTVEDLVDAYAHGNSAKAMTSIFHTDIKTNTGQNRDLLLQAFFDDRRNFNSISFQRPLVFDSETVIPEDGKVTIVFHWYRTAYFARSGEQWKADDRATISMQYGEWPVGPAIGDPAVDNAVSITQKGFRITEIVYNNRNLPMIGIADVSGRLTVGGGDVNGTTVTTPTTADQGTFGAGGSGGSGGGGGGATPSITSLLNALDRSTITKGSSTIQYVVIITGTNFGSTAGTVTFGSTNALSSDIISWSDTEIQARVPSGMTAGSAAVRVTSSTGIASSNTAAFTVIPSGTFTLGAGQSFTFSSGSVGADNSFPNNSSDLNANIIGGDTFIAAGDPGASPPATVNGRIGILGTFNSAGNISAIQQASATSGTTPDVSADPGESPPQASQPQPVGTLYLIRALSGQFARIRLTSATGTGTAGVQFTFDYVFNNADASSTF